MPNQDGLRPWLQVDGVIAPGAGDTCRRCHSLGGDVARPVGVDRRGADDGGDRIGYVLGNHVDDVWRTIGRRGSAGVLRHGRLDCCSEDWHQQLLDDRLRSRAEAVWAERLSERHSRRKRRGSRLGDCGGSQRRLAAVGAIAEP